MRDASDHLPHRGQPLTLYYLLLQLFLDRDVAHRNDDPAQLGFSVEKLAGRGAHGTPRSIAVSRAVLGRGKNLLARRNVMVKGGELRGMVFEIGNLLAEQILRLISQQVADS